MKNTNPQWSKKELNIYILLLCAKADFHETTKELDLIKSKIDEKTFERLYAEFSNDDEDSSILKIEDAIARHEYSYIELIKIKQEVMDVFKTDKKFHLMEHRLSDLLDNILY
ncbi:hypothetical protein KCTC52924_03272 [Arenibacter antarcticus]|uniref:Tellurite resistance protein TerB n=1 Tax=Arenibacter antarcticus TaxID=2040469 RepID=A0ABW5VH45_9FLAO|nr:hypothetical protein [Arenibacter sp. H213]MCM4166340.1 hypothetical protein [Arenibacter sp. H213]